MQYTDPDDHTLHHMQVAARVPVWAAATALGRMYVRRRLRRRIAAHTTRTGYTLEGELCFHFGTIEGIGVAVAHFTARDTLAAAYAHSGADQ